MNVVIIATKNCNHRPMLEKNLQSLGVSYSVQFVDDYPELIPKYDIRRSPNLVVDEQVVFRPGTGKTLPTPAELNDYLKLN